MKYSMKQKTLVMSTAVIMSLGLASSAYAVTGVCSDCHTMHASENGGLNDPSGAAMTTGPNHQLLIKNGCVGCHADGTTTNTSTLDVIDNAPQIIADAATLGPETELAGGFFNTNAGAIGGQMHNPSDLTALGTIVADGTLVNPPGGVVGVPLWTADGATTQLSCAGSTNGCHATGGHHKNTPSDNQVGGTTVGDSYRFLKPTDGVMTGTNFVQGYEDGDYELTNSSSDHNQYFGAVRTKAGAETSNGTVSAFCAGCHEDFHTMADITDTSSWWVRHPTDFDLNALAATSEYADYGGAGVNAYQVAVPVASDVVTATKSTVLQAAGDAIVICLSCHRAHGSKHNNLLRWDYTTMIANGGSNTNGCFACHTTKDI